MAYGVRWKVNFVALNGDKYRIEILQDGWIAEPVRLLGAESPIETRDDDTTDLFDPIRKQTGFIRIVDTGYDLDGNPFDYEDMIPEGLFDFQVRLWLYGNTDTLRWIGYLRPDSLTSQLFEYVSIREFAIACPLSIMYDVPFSFSNNNENKGTVKTMGQILHAALSATGIAWNNVYKQNNISYRDDLTATVSLLNFIGSTTPSSVSAPPTNDPHVFSATWEEEGTYWGEVVETICRFWGWVIYSRANDIHIITPGDINLFTSFQFSELLSLKIDFQEDITTPEAILTDDDFVSTNHSSQRIQGHKMIKVVSDVNEHKEIAKPNFNDLPLEYYPQGQIIHNFGSDTMYVLKRFATNNISQNSGYHYSGNLQLYQNTNIQGGSLVIPWIIALVDSFKSDEFAKKTEFNFRSDVVIPKGGQKDGIIFYVKTINDVIVSGSSMICISARFYKDLSNGNSNSPTPVPSGNPAAQEEIKAALSVGQKYYNQSTGEWTNNEESYMTLKVREDGSITSPVNLFTNQGFSANGILFDNHYGSSGFCVEPPHDGLCGRLMLRIFKSGTNTPASYSVKCIMTDLSIFIVNYDNKMNPVNKSEHTYSTVGNNKFLTDYVVNNRLSSGEQNNYGLGQLYTVNNFIMLPLVDVRISEDAEEQVVPEVNLMNRLKKVYSSVTRIDTIEVKDNMTASLPITQLTVNNNNYRVVSCSHNWRECKMNLTITDKT